MTDRTPGFFRCKVRCFGLLTSAGAIAAVATLLGFFGRFSWVLDLFSHFRVQYMFGLLALGLLFLARRHYRTAVAFLILAAVNLALTLPLYFGGQDRQEDAEDSLRAMLINVNTQYGDADRVRAVITNATPHILVLEEISARWMETLNDLTNAYPYSLTRTREDNFGIGLFSTLPIVEGDVVYMGGANVPSIVATLHVADTRLRVVATHPLPPASRSHARWRNAQLEQLPAYTRSDHPTLLIGDLNVTPWNYYFRRLLIRSGLRDSARGFGVRPTWQTDIPFLAIPLDHCLHSDNIVITDRRIGESVSSDHRPLIVDFIIEL